MICVQNFPQQLADRLPQTFAILSAANLIVHEKASRVILHGSRGLAIRFRLDSDIDLSPILDACIETDVNLLQDIYQTTMANWKSVTALDLTDVK